MVVYVSCRAGHPRVASLAALPQFTFCPPTPPLQPSALAYVRRAVVSLPYGMGKSINFTPTLPNAAQSKKEAPETGASLRLL